MLFRKNMSTRIKKGFGGDSKMWIWGYWRCSEFAVVWRSWSPSGKKPKYWSFDVVRPDVSKHLDQDGRPHVVVPFPTPGWSLDVFAMLMPELLWLGPNGVLFLSYLMQELGNKIARKKSPNWQVSISPNFPGILGTLAATWPITVSNWCHRQASRKKGTVKRSWIEDFHNPKMDVKECNRLTACEDGISARSIEWLQEWSWSGRLVFVKGCGWWACAAVLSTPPGWWLMSLGRMTLSMRAFWRTTRLCGKDTLRSCYICLWSQGWYCCYPWDRSYPGAAPPCFSYG